MKGLGLFLAFWFSVANTELFAQQQYTLWGETLFKQKESPDLDSEQFKNRNKNKTLRIGTLESPDTFNVLDSPDSYFSRLCYARLFNLTPSGLESDVADVNFDYSGNLLITIKTNFSARDLERSIDFFRENGKPELQNALSLIAKIKINSKTKKKIHLSFSSENRFKILSALSRMPILRRAFFKDWKKDMSRLKWDKPLCTGFYGFSQKKLKRGKQMLYVREKEYFKNQKETLIPKGKYNFPKIILRYYKDSQDLRNALDKGEIEFYTNKETPTSFYGQSYHYQSFPKHRFNLPYVVLFNPAHTPMNLRSYRTWLRQFFQSQNAAEVRDGIGFILKDSAFSLDKISFPARKTIFQNEISQRNAFFKDLIEEDLPPQGMIHIRGAMRQKTDFSVLILEKDLEIRETIKKKLKDIENQIKRFFHRTNKKLDDISKKGENSEPEVHFLIDAEDSPRKLAPRTYDLIIMKFPGPEKIDKLRNHFNSEMINYKEDLNFIFDKIQNAHSQDDFILWLWLLEKLFYRDNLALKLDEISESGNNSPYNSDKIYAFFNQKKIALPRNIEAFSNWPNVWPYIYSIEPEIVVEKPEKSKKSSSQKNNSAAAKPNPPAPQNTKPQKEESFIERGVEGLKKLFGGN